MGSLDPAKDSKPELNDSGYVQEDPAAKNAPPDQDPPEPPEYRGSVELMDLSDDELFYILRYCSPRDLKALGFTCPRLGALVTDRKLWQNVDTREWASDARRMHWYLCHCLHESTSVLKVAGHARELKRHVPPAKEQPSQANGVEKCNGGLKQDLCPGNLTDKPSTSKQADELFEKPPPATATAEKGVNTEISAAEDPDEGSGTPAEAPVNTDPMSKSADEKDDKIEGEKTDGEKKNSEKTAEDRIGDVSVKNETVTTDVPVTKVDKNVIMEKPVTTDPTNDIKHEPVTKDASNDTKHEPVTKDEKNDTKKEPVTKDDKNDIKKEPVTNDATNDTKDECVTKEDKNGIKDETAAKVDKCVTKDEPITKDASNDNKDGSVKNESATSDTTKNDTQDPNVIKKVVVPKVSVTAQTLKALCQKCPNLTELALEYCVIDGSKALITMFPPKLKKLSFLGSECIRLDKSFLHKIQEHLVDLEELDVSYCEWIEPACLLPMSKLPKLKVLTMRHCSKLTEFVAYAALSTRYGFKALRSLDLRGSPVSDTEVCGLCVLPRLHTLRLAAPNSAAERPERRPAHQPLLHDWEAEEPEYYKTVTLPELEEQESVEIIQNITENTAYDGIPYENFMPPRRQFGPTGYIIADTGNRRRVYNFRPVIRERPDLDPPSVNRAGPSQPPAANRNSSNQGDAGKRASTDDEQPGPSKRAKMEGEEDKGVQVKMSEDAEAQMEDQAKAEDQAKMNEGGEGNQAKISERRETKIIGGGDGKMSDERDDERGDQDKMSEGGQGKLSEGMSGEAVMSDGDEPKMDEEQAEMSDGEEPKMDEDEAEMSDGDEPKIDEDQAKKSDGNEPKTDEDEAEISDGDEPKTDEDEAETSDGEEPKLSEEEAKEKGKDAEFEPKEGRMSDGSGSSKEDKKSLKEDKKSPKENKKSPKEDDDDDSGPDDDKKGEKIGRKVDTMTDEDKKRKILNYFGSRGQVPMKCLKCDKYRLPKKRQSGPARAPRIFGQAGSSRPRKTGESGPSKATGKTDESGPSKATKKMDESGPSKATNKMDESGPSKATKKMDESGPSKATRKMDESGPSKATGKMDESGPSKATGKMDESGPSKATRKTDESGLSKATRKMDESGPSKATGKMDESGPSKSKRKSNESGPSKSKRKSDESGPSKATKKMDESGPSKAAGKMDESGPSKEARNMEEAGPSGGPIMRVMGETGPSGGIRIMGGFSPSGPCRIMGQVEPGNAPRYIGQFDLPIPGVGQMGAGDAPPYIIPMPRSMAEGGASRPRNSDNANNEPQPGPSRPDNQPRPPKRNNDSDDETENDYLPSIKRSRFVIKIGSADGNQDRQNQRPNNEENDPNQLEPLANAEVHLGNNNVNEGDVQVIDEDGQEVRHRVLYVNVGRRRAPYYQMAAEPMDLRTNSPNISSLFFASHWAPRVDHGSLVTDASIRQFGRADNDNINYIEIGPNGPVAAPYEDPNANRSNLRVLSATGYRYITDHSLVHLTTAAPHLRVLDLSDTNVSERGVERFKNLRPDCEVKYSKYVRKDGPPAPPT